MKRKLIAAIALTILLTIPVLAGDLNSPPKEPPPPPDGLLAQIIKIITG